MLDFGFQKRSSVLDEEAQFGHEDYQREKETRLDQIENALFPDYGDDYDDYIQKRRRKLFSLVTQETNSTLKTTSDARLNMLELHRRQRKDSVPQLPPESQKTVGPLQSAPSQSSKHDLLLQQNQTEFNPDVSLKKTEQLKGKRKPKGKLRTARRPKFKPVEKAVRPGQTNPTVPADREQPKAKEQLVIPSEPLNPKQHNIHRLHKMNHTKIQRLKGSMLQLSENDAPLPEKPTAAKHQIFETRDQRLTTPKRGRPLVKLSQRNADARKHLRDKEIKMNVPLQLDVVNSVHKANIIVRGKMNKRRSDTKGEGKIYSRDLNRGDIREDKRNSAWGPGEDFEGTDDEEQTPAPVFDTEVNWSQTFQVSPLDLQAQRSDWIDLQCNISGNLLLSPSDAVPLIKVFMEQLNEKHRGYVHIFFLSTFNLLLSYSKSC